MITRLWGKADKHELEFTQIFEDKWKADVPADFTDGCYVVELTAMNHRGYTTSWIGTLYMLQGTPCLHIKPPKYLIWLKPQRYEIVMKERCCYCGK